MDDSYSIVEWYQASVQCLSIDFIFHAIEVHDVVSDLPPMKVLIHKRLCVRLASLHIFVCKFIISLLLGNIITRMILLVRLSEASLKKPAGLTVSRKKNLSVEHM